MSRLRGRPGRLFVVPPRPHLHSAWNTRLISLTILVATAGPVAVTAYRHGAMWFPLLLVSVLIAILWEAVFALARRRPMAVDGVVNGLVFATMAGPQVPLWQVALSLSFGVIAGEQVFGGRGHNFLNPAVVALAFLMFSFPNTSVDELGEAAAIAVLPGAALLVATGLVSWRIVVSAAAGLVAGAFALGASDPLSGLTTGSFAFGLVFLACDPVSSASTNSGRWFYGALFGALAVALAGGAGSPSAKSVVFAALLGSVLAPLIDQAAVYVNAYRRRRRNG